MRHVRASVGSGTPFFRYLHKDHLGSIAAITDQAGAVIERLAYDPWGKRRFPGGADDTSNTIVSEQRRGFTGHEHLAQVALVHMNGRIYDPAIGRMMSADPFVQDPTNGQTLNRYAYVINNPLAYTDPNGFFFKSIFRAVSNIVGGVVKAVAGNPIGQMAIQIGAYAYCGPPCVAAAAAVTTSVNGGSLGDSFKAAVVAYASSYAFGKIGTSGWGTVGKALASGAVGGITSAVQGGDFKSGFLTAGFSALAGPTLGEALGGGRIGEGIARAVVGGTASVIGGGKFVNGAASAAMAYAIGEIARDFNTPGRCLNCGEIFDDIAESDGSNTTVEVRFRQVQVLGINTGYDHAFIVVTDNLTGVQTVHQAGPLGPCGSCGLLSWGSIEASAESYDPRSRGYSQNYFSAGVFSTDVSAAAINRQLVSYAAQFNSQQTPYILFGQNSNSYVSNAVRLLVGTAPSIPVGANAPGWHRSLSGS